MSAAPKLRGLGMRAWARGLYASLFVSCATAVWIKTNVVEARKKHYEEFYETYDDDKAFAEMKKAGIFRGFENAA